MPKTETASASCAFVAGVVSPLLSASMLQLALGASLLTVLGVLAWGWYNGVTREAVLPVSGADAAAVMEAEIAEPR